MKHTKNKAFSILLTLVMLAGLIPWSAMPARAEGELGTGVLFVCGVDIVADGDHTVSGANGGTAVLSYDNEGCPVLTLTNYSYSGDGMEVHSISRAAIYYTGSTPLTIKLTGENSIAETPSGITSAYGICSEKAGLSFAGGGRLSVTGSGAESYGVYCGSGDVTVEKGTTLAAEGGKNGVCCGSGGVTVGSGAALTAEGGAYGIECKTSVTVESGAELTASGNHRAIGGTVINHLAGSGYEGTCDTDIGYKIDVCETGQEMKNQELNVYYRCVRFPASYDLWVGGTRAVTGNTSGEGWSYDAEKNILSLTNYTYSGAAEPVYGNKACYAAIAWFGTEPLTIELTGGNSVTETASGKDEVYGIYSKNAGLSLTGTGSLSAEGGEADKNSYGVNCGGALTVDGVKLTATGGDMANIGSSCGVNCDGALTVSGEGGSLTAKGGKVAKGISNGVCCDALTVSGGAKLTAEGGEKADWGDSYGITFSGDITVTGKGSELTATGKNKAIIGQHNVTVGTGARLTAEGVGAGINNSSHIVTVESGAVLIASGGSYSIDGYVKNADVGAACDSTDGNGAWTTVPVNTDQGQILHGYKKAEFIPLALTLNANDGSASPATETLTAACHAENEPNAETFRREGYVLAGWNTRDDGSGTAYGAKPAVTEDGLTLYAMWKKIFTVAVTAGGNMTKTEGSGAESQSVVDGSTITDIVYTANEGYCFPEDYSVDTVNGVSVTRDGFTQITVSGTPTAEAAITLADAAAKTTPKAPGAGKTDCTVSTDDNGTLTGVTTDMEYKKSDVEEWTSGTGEDITGLAPGTYLVRYKATDTAYASEAQELTIAPCPEPSVSGAFTSGKLTAKVTAPDGGTLIAALYDASGALAGVWTKAVTASAAEQSFDTGMEKTEGCTCKLMLVDSNYAPLCAAWEN